MFVNDRNTGNFFRLPPATKNLLIVNIGLWLLCSVMPSFGDTIYDYLGLHYWGSGSFNPLQFVTYMFLQAPLGSGTGIGHIFFNMFALYMFGRILEATWGTRRFLIFYLACGLGAAFVQEAVWSLSFNEAMVSSLSEANGMSGAMIQDILARDPAHARELASQYADMLLTIGASGAIFGLLLGFGCVFPNVPMYLFFIPIPIKAKYLVAGYAVLEFVFGITGTASMVAHFAHLGGMLFAIPFLIYWHKKHILHGRRY
ncbi:MAG: rhomboid family intramembrane serine protease [Muribaculaceae bacterium]|nr:rhomboid family intramembrane serine protease [Muribaculaceae bacterium]